MCGLSPYDVQAKPVIQYTNASHNLLEQVFCNEYSYTSTSGYAEPVIVQRQSMKMVALPSGDGRSTAVKVPCALCFLYSQIK